MTAVGRFSKSWLIYIPLALPLETDSSPVVADDHHNAIGRTRRGLPSLLPSLGVVLNEFLDPLTTTRQECAKYCFNALLDIATLLRMH